MKPDDSTTYMKYDWVCFVSAGAAASPPSAGAASAGAAASSPSAPYDDWCVIPMAKPAQTASIRRTKTPARTTAFLGLAPIIVGTPLLVRGNQNCQMLSPPTQRRRAAMLRHCGWSGRPGRMKPERCSHVIARTLARLRRFSRTNVLGQAAFSLTRAN